MFSSGSSPSRVDGEDSPLPTPPHESTTAVDIPPLSDEDNNNPTPHTTSSIIHNSSSNIHGAAAAWQRGDGDDDVALRPVLFSTLPAANGSNNTNITNTNIASSSSTTTRVRKQLLNRTKRSVSCLVSTTRFILGLPLLIVNSLRLFIFEALCDGPLWARGLNLILMGIIVVLTVVLSGDLWRHYKLTHAGDTTHDNNNNKNVGAADDGGRQHQHHSVFFAGNSGARKRRGGDGDGVSPLSESSPLANNQRYNNNLPVGRGEVMNDVHRKQVVGGLLHKYKDSLNRRPGDYNDDGGAASNLGSAEEGPLGHVVHHDHHHTAGYDTGRNEEGDSEEEDTQLLPPTSIHKYKKDALNNQVPWWRKVIAKGSNLLHLGAQQQPPSKPSDDDADAEGGAYRDGGGEANDNADGGDAAQHRANNEAVLLESYKREIASVRSKIDRLEKIGKRHQQHDSDEEDDDGGAIGVSTLVNELHDLRLSAKRLQYKLNAQDRLEKEYDFLEEQDRHRDWKHDQLRKEWAQEKLDAEELVQDGDDNTRSSPTRRRSTQHQATFEVAHRSSSPDDDSSSSCPGLGITGGSKGDTIPSEIASPFLPYPTYELIGLEVAEFAYVTFVTSHTYVQQAATLMYSIAVSGSVYSRCVLISKGALSKRDQQTLSLFARVIEVDAIPSPLFISNPQYVDTFTKLRIWELEPLYRKILYIDSDVIIKRSLDHLFDIDAPWVVPMDAEQSRYSTGMMLLQPSLSTFDKMMVSLKRDVTGDMMVLPDLLFLKNFFENVMPREAKADNDALMAVYQQAHDAWRQRKAIFESQVDIKEKEFYAEKERRVAAGDTGDYSANGAYRSSYFFRPSFTEDSPSPPPQSALKPLSYITLMSRWYQVYQEEFGNHYASFMSRRRQKITIHDSRVFGIHYPGNAKPWHGDFEGKFKKFSAGFCVWPAYQREFMMTGVAVRARRFAPEDELFWDIRKEGEKNSYAYWGTDGEKLKKQQDQSENRMHLRSLRHVDQAEGAALSIRNALTQKSTTPTSATSQVVGSHQKQSAKNKRNLAKIDKNNEELKSIMRPFDYEPAFWWFLYYKMMLNSLNTLAMNAAAESVVDSNATHHHVNMKGSSGSRKYAANTLEEFADGHLDTILGKTVDAHIAGPLQNKQIMDSKSAVIPPSVRAGATATGGGMLIGGPSNADAFFSAGINAEDDLRKQGDRAAENNKDGVSSSDDDSDDENGNNRGGSSKLTSLERQRIEDALSALVFLENEEMAIKESNSDNAAMRGQLDQMDASYNTALDVFAPSPPSPTSDPDTAVGAHKRSHMDDVLNLENQDGSSLRVIRASISAYLKRRRWFVPKYPSLGIRSDITRPLISFLPRTGVKLTDVIRVYRAYTKKESEVMQLIESERKRADAMQGALDGLNNNFNNGGGGWQQQNNNYNNNYNQYTSPPSNYNNNNYNPVPPNQQQQQPISSIWDAEWRSSPWAYYLHKAFPELYPTLLSTSSTDGTWGVPSSPPTTTSSDSSSKSSIISATTFIINVASKRIRDSLRVPKIEFTLPDVIPIIRNPTTAAGHIDADADDVDVRVEYPGTRKNEDIRYIGGGGDSTSLLHSVYPYMFGGESTKAFLRNAAKSLSYPHSNTIATQNKQQRCSSLPVNSSNITSSSSSVTSTVLRVPLVIRAPVLHHIEAHMVHSNDGDIVENTQLLSRFDSCRRNALVKSIWPRYRQHLSLLRSTTNTLSSGNAEETIRQLQYRMVVVLSVTTTEMVSIMESVRPDDYDNIITGMSSSSYSSAASSSSAVASSCSNDTANISAASVVVGIKKGGGSDVVANSNIQKSLTTLMNIVASEMEACSSSVTASTTTPSSTAASAATTTSIVRKWWSGLRRDDKGDNEGSPFVVLLKDAPVASVHELFPGEASSPSPTKASSSPTATRGVSLVVRLGASVSPSPMGGAVLERIASINAARWESEATTTTPAPTTTTPAPYYWGNSWGASSAAKNLPDLPTLVEIELISDQPTSDEKMLQQQQPSTTTTTPESQWVPKPPPLSSSTTTTMPPSQAIKSSPFIEVSFKGKVLLTSDNATLRALLGSGTSSPMGGKNEEGLLGLQWGVDTRHNNNNNNNIVRRRLNGLQKTLRGLYGLAGWNRPPASLSSSTVKGGFGNASYVSMLTSTTTTDGGKPSSLAQSSVAKQQQQVHHYTSTPNVKMLTLSLAKAKRAYAVYTSNLRATNNALCLSLQPLLPPTTRRSHHKRVVSVVIGGHLYKCAAVSATAGFVLQKVPSSSPPSCPPSSGTKTSPTSTPLSTVGAPVTFEEFLEAVVGKRGGVVLPQKLRTPHYFDIIQKSYEVGGIHKSGGGGAADSDATTPTTILEAIIADSVLHSYYSYIDGDDLTGAPEDNGVEDDAIIVAIVGTSVSTVSHPPHQVKRSNHFTTVLTCPTPTVVTTTTTKKHGPLTSVINLPGELGLVTPAPTSTVPTKTTDQSDSSAAPSSSSNSDAKYWKEYANNNNIRLDNDDDNDEEDENTNARVPDAPTSTTPPPSLPTFAITLPYNITWVAATTNRLLVTLSNSSSVPSATTPEDNDDHDHGATTPAITTAYVVSSSTSKHSNHMESNTASSSSAALDDNIMKVIREVRMSRNDVEKRAEYLRGDVLGMMNISRMEELFNISSTTTIGGAISPLDLYLTSTSTTTYTNNNMKANAPSESLLSALLARSLQELSTVIDEPIHAPLLNLSMEVSRVSVQLKASLDNARTIIRNAASTDNLVYMSSALEALQSLNITSRSILAAADNFTSVDNVHRLLIIASPSNHASAGVEGGGGGDVGNLLQSPHLAWLLQPSEREDSSVRTMYSMESIMETCHTVASNIVNRLQNRDSTNNDEEEHETRPVTENKKKNNGRRRLTQMEAGEGRILGGEYDFDNINAQDENDNQRVLQNEHEDELIGGDATTFATSPTSSSLTSGDGDDTTNVLSERQSRINVLRDMRHTILSIVADVVPELQRQTYLLDCLKMRVELVRNTLGKRIAFIGKLELQEQKSPSSPKPSSSSSSVSDEDIVMPISGVVYDISSGATSTTTNPISTTSRHHAIFVESVSACQLSKNIIHSLTDEAAPESGSDTTTSSTHHLHESNVVATWVEMRWQMSKVAALQASQSTTTTSTHTTTYPPKGVVEDFKKWKENYLLSLSSKPTAPIPPSSPSLSNHHRPMSEGVLDQISVLKDTWMVQDAKVYAYRVEEDLVRMEDAVVTQAHKEHALLVIKYRISNNTHVAVDVIPSSSSQNIAGSTNAIDDNIVLGSGGNSDTVSTTTSSPRADHAYAPLPYHNGVMGVAASTPTTSTEKKDRDKYLMIPLLDAGDDSSTTDGGGDTTTTTTTSSSIKMRGMKVHHASSTAGGMDQHVTNSSTSSTTAATEVSTPTATTTSAASAVTTKYGHLGGMGGDTTTIPTTTLEASSSTETPPPTTTATPPPRVTFTTLLQRYISQNSSISSSSSTSSSTSSSLPPAVVVKRLEQDLATAHSRESELQELLLRPPAASSSSEKACKVSSSSSLSSTTTTIFDRCSEVLKRSCQDPDSWDVPSTWPYLSQHGGGADDKSPLWLPELVTINLMQNGDVGSSSSTGTTNTTMPAALMLLRDSLRTLLKRGGGGGGGAVKSCNPTISTSPSKSSTLLLTFCTQYMGQHQQQLSLSSPLTSSWIRVAKQGDGVYVVSTDINKVTSSSSSSTTTMSLSDRWGTLLSKSTRIALLNTDEYHHHLNGDSTTPSTTTTSTAHVGNQLKRGEFVIKPLFGESASNTDATNLFWTPATTPPLSATSFTSLASMSKSMDLSKWAFTRKLAASLHTLSLVLVADNNTLTSAPTTAVTFNLTVTVAVRVNMTYPVVHPAQPPPATYSPYYYSPPTSSTPSPYQEDSETVLVKRRRLVRKSILLRLPLPPSTTLGAAGGGSRAAGEDAADSHAAQHSLWHSKLRTNLIRQIETASIGGDSILNAHTTTTGATFREALLQSFVAPHVAPDECLEYTETSQGLLTSTQNEQQHAVSSSSTILSQFAKLAEHQLISVDWNPMVAHRRLPTHHHSGDGVETLEMSLLRGPGGTLPIAELTSLPHRTLQYFDETILSPILEASLLNYTTSVVSASGKGAKRGTTDKPLYSRNQDSSSSSSQPTTTATEGEQQILERALNRAIDQMGGGNGEGNVHGHIGGDDNVVADALKKVLLSAVTPRGGNTSTTTTDVGEDGSKRTSIPPPSKKSRVHRSSSSPTDILRSAVVELLRNSLLSPHNNVTSEATKKATAPAQTNQLLSTTMMRTQCIVYNLHSHQQAHTLHKLPLVNLHVPGGGRMGHMGSTGGSDNDDSSRRDIQLQRGCGVRGSDGSICDMSGYNVFVKAI